MSEDWRKFAGQKGGLASRKYKIDNTFFDKWNSKIAYILGFIFTDGSINKNTLSFEVQEKDKNLIAEIRKTLKSNAYIENTHKKDRKYVRLRINSIELIKKLNKLGITANKTKICKFPIIPDEYLGHFIRGVLDGDGWISIRSKRQESCIGFSSGSYEFIKGLIQNLNKHLNLTRNNLRERKKKIKNDKISTYYQIEWYSDNGFKVIEFLYGNLKNSDIFLKRKYEKQLLARKIYEESKKTPIWRDLEKEYKKPLGELLNYLINKKGLNAYQIADKLGISSSQIYRLINKTVIKNEK